MSSTGEHLKPYHFPEGVSGNPNGRPKGSLNSKTILEKLLAGEETIKDKDGNIMRVSREEYMHLQQIRKAIKGDTRAYKEILDRTEGAVKKEVELSGEVSNPQQVTVYIPDNGRTPTAEGS